MKLFVFSDGVRHGCYVYREEIPLEALERRGHTITGGLARPDQLDLSDIDAFIFPRLAAQDYPLVVDEIQRNGKPLIYEMDDAADLFERYHTSYFQVTNLLPSYYFFLREADLVTTTTPHLADHFRSLGAQRVEVLPNCPNLSTWTPDGPKPIRSGPVRIGYTGWTAHLLDAAYWLEIMAALRQHRQDFTPVLFGLSTTATTGPEWMEKCREAVNQNPLPNFEFGQSLLAFHRAWVPLKECLEWHSMVPVDDYATRLADLHLDIGCATLLDTPFNRCKSGIKAYDYAGAGAVTVASDVLPYNQEPCSIPVPNTLDAWVRMLSLLLDSQTHRSLRLADQRAWIREHRDPDVWAVRREQVYQSLLTPALVS